MPGSGRRQGVFVTGFFSKKVYHNVLREAHQRQYGLLVMGASKEYEPPTRLFGGVDDWVAGGVEHCSVLLVRQHEAALVCWLGRIITHEEG